MTKGQRTIATLLAVVAVLLALNFVRATPNVQAQAQPQAAGPQHPVPVALTVAREHGDNATEFRLFRLWSDGEVDMTFVLANGNNPNWCDPPIQCGPVSIIAVE